MEDVNKLNPTSFPHFINMDRKKIKYTTVFVFSLTAINKVKYIEDLQRFLFEESIINEGMLTRYESIINYSMLARYESINNVGMLARYESN